MSVPKRKRKRRAARRAPAIKSWPQRNLVENLEHWADRLLGIPFDPSGHARKCFEKDAVRRSSLGPIPLSDEVRKEVAAFLRRLAQMRPRQLEAILPKRAVGRRSKPRNSHIALDIRFTRNRLSLTGRNTKDADPIVMDAWGIARSDLYRIKAAYEKLDQWKSWAELWTDCNRERILRQHPGIQEAELLEKMSAELRRSG